MFEIYSNSKLIAIVQNPNWVRKHDVLNEFILTDMENAQGISLQNATYALPGHEDALGLPQAVIVRADGGLLIEAEIQHNDTQDEAIIELAELVCELHPKAPASDAALVSLFSKFNYADGKETRMAKTYVELIKHGRRALGQVPYLWHDEVAKIMESEGIE